MKRIDKIKEYILLFLRSTLNSYSAVYFSNNKMFACMLIAVTFFNLQAGISGLIAIVISNGVALAMGYNQETIHRGYYGFNSLLVGLGLGVTYAPGLPFYLLLVCAALLTFFLSIAMEGIIGKYALPFLSVPFLLSIWLITMASKHYTSLEISQSGVYLLNELYAVGGNGMVSQYHQLNNLGIPLPWAIYFKSLSAIFFQYNILAGMIVAIGLLIYSRIAFSLSLLGFFTAYLFYLFIGGNINELSYHYIGFNFILTAIAIGGFFIIPSRASYLWVIILTPLIAIVTSGSTMVLWTFQLSIFSLPFNVIVLLFLYILKFRVRQTLHIEETRFQQYTPERNLYLHQSSKSRFINTYYFPVALPFWGTWTVTQGNNTQLTHKEEWKYAWDFMIEDHNRKAYEGSGYQKKDYYSFEKPVVAPADGEISEVVSVVADNEIGEVNINENWGNTVIIKHSNGLYSKLSHLKKDSIKVKKGNYVMRGDLIGQCGNSGRSPIPHIHFQMQTSPHVQAKTIEYPISYYVLHQKESFEFKQFEKPKEGDQISNVEKNMLLVKAFSWVPGQKFSFEVQHSSDESLAKNADWEVEVDAYNNAYLFCRETRSKAYFYDDGVIHYFKHFEGDKNSLLFYFYMASFKVMKGFYKKLIVKDQYPAYLLNNKGLLFFQDFLAPFIIFTKANYAMQYEHIDDPMASKYILLKSHAIMNLGSYQRKKMNFEIEIRDDRVASLKISGKALNIHAVNLLSV